VRYRGGVLICGGVAREWEDEFMLPIELCCFCLLCCVVCGCEVA